jgi:flagellin
MTITAASNVASLRAQTQLSRTTQKLSTVYERLSSGLRINRASDDPAGLSLADSLRADSRIAAVAIRNANDGISITSIANAALDEISNILTRLSELATQSANGVYTNAQRSALSSEFVALGSEIERIAVTTEFNGVKLLSGSNTVTLQVGLDGSANSRISIQAVQATLQAVGLASPGSSALSFSIIGTTSAASQLAAQNALDQITLAISSLSTIRGTIGAAESRLNVAIGYLQVARENFIAAESRIRDADIAAETAELVRLQVLQQAGVAVLAQANQQPALVRDLLE